jgi:hypothetical protein
MNTLSFEGLTLDEPVYFPTFIPSLEGKKWVKFSGGLHHTLGLTASGKIRLIIFLRKSCLVFLR